MTTPSYSQILTEFIDPLLDGNENESTYLDKANIGMVVWNYHVTKTHAISHAKAVKEVYDVISQTFPDGPAMMASLLERKEKSYGHVHQFLVKIELKDGRNGQRRLNVESMHIDHLEALFRDRTGSLKLIPVVGEKNNS